ncbi:MAG: D-alanyl-D-alanine carboxypeptidase family protein [Candidatus Pacebacteria bacterium]|nr:D-alanyl-D-alanine carboxypeptidase family protein [Candidatus Paceibacterota bacterium]
MRAVIHRMSKSMAGTGQSLKPCMRMVTIVLLCLGMVAILAEPALAEVKNKKQYSRHIRRFLPPPVSSSIVVDSDSGEVLFESQSNRLVKPASLTKMMTLYLVFQRLADGSLQLDQNLKVTRHATLQSPMSLGLRLDSPLTVEQAILGVVTKSANDAAVVLAENLAPSEARFADRMTATAKKLGMTKTVFKNASGLPDSNQVTTARDMAILGISLIRHYPQYYGYFGVKNFTYQGNTMINHNHLLGEIDGVDGIKTGYIRAAGFNLVASASRNGRRVVVVVIGGSSSTNRDNRVISLMNAAFETFGSEVDSQDVAVDGEPQSPEAAMAELTPQKTDAEGEPIPNAVTAAAPAAEPAPMASSTPVVQSVVSVGGTSALVNRLNRPLITDEPAEPPSKSKAKGRKLWAIQVGAFTTAKAANLALAEANRLVPRLRQTGKVIVLPKTNQIPYRARIIGLSPNLATAACRDLERNGMSCRVVKAGG